MENQTSSNIYALLIGINYYFPNTFSDGNFYPCLKGAVRDINFVESFLTNTRKIPTENIFKLTASASVNSELPLESNENLPTYKNIVTKFQELTKIVSKGDQIYIHYSGHGASVATEIPEEKGENGTDESIVPTDIGLQEGRYLKDFELAKLLQNMVDKGLVVTIVLDSCYSGGATKGEVNIRGIGKVDDTVRTTKSLVADLEELKANWLSSAEKSNTRSVYSNLVSNTNDYVLLAACRPTEFAFEYLVDRKKGIYGGALTNFLLESFKQLSPNLTYKNIHENLYTKIHSKFPLQTPMLVGNGNRVVFGDKYEQKAYYVLVLQVDKVNQRVLLGVGESVGFGVDDQFAIYPQGADFTKIEQRIAVATISECGATESWCHLELIEKEAIVKQADQAVPLAAPIYLVKQVLLWYKDEANAEERSQNPFPFGKLSPEIYLLQEEALEAVKNALKGNGWVEATEESEEEIRYQVAVNERGEYEICDLSGQPLPNLHPPLKINEPNSANKLVNRLVHLAKYHSIYELNNYDQNSPLLGKLEFEWLGKSKNHSRAKPIPPKSKLQSVESPFEATVIEGEWIFLKIKNNSNRILNIAVLELDIDWAVLQVFPPNQGELFVTLAPGQEEKLSFNPSLIEGYEKGTEFLKLFATIGSPNFRVLELPPLDQPKSKGNITRGNDPLEKLLANIDDEQPATKRLNLAQSASNEWITVQISLTIKKP